MEEIQTFWSLVDKSNIEIPIIQRDYAQGRTNNQKAEKVREEFLPEIKSRLDNKESLHLDFIYGCEQNNNLIILDGQQRLTTLFLFHWYTAVKEKYFDNTTKDKLKRFTCGCGARLVRFCSKLAGYNPNLSDISGKISSLIKNEHWFFFAWENDPTIVSMLNMLDAIHKLFKNSNVQYFPLLASDAKIGFHFLNLEEFQLSDSLYIKMNARGKPLTEFENFKAGYEAYLSKNTEKQKIFSTKADNDWTELFFEEAKKNDVLYKNDDYFMNYIDYITEIGVYLSSEDAIPINNNTEKYKILVIEEYRDLLFDSLDVWFKIKDKDAYFERFFSKNEYVQGKVCLYEDDVNLFSRCIQKTNFDNREKLLLFGIILQLKNNKDQSKELRLLRNLLLNSTNELRSAKLHDMFKVVKNIFIIGIDFSALSPFNGPQITDEKIKAGFLTEHPELAGKIYRLEDHELLRGRLLTFILDNKTIAQHVSNFYILFGNDPNWVDIHRVLLCLGTEAYAEEIGYNRWRFANNHDTWEKLLTSGNPVRLREPLDKLLNVLSIETISDIIETTLSNYKGKDKDWRYYFVKYKTMNCGNTGIFVRWDDFNLAMLNTTKLSGYWRDPYLWTVYKGFEKDETEDNGSLWNMGYGKNPLRVNNLEISCAENGWQIGLAEDGKDFQDRYAALCKKHEINIDNGIFAVETVDDRIEKILPVLHETAEW
jgi:hypothetical protein